MNEKTEKNISTLKTVMIILLIITVLAVSKISGAVSIRILLAFFIFLLVLPLVSALENAGVADKFTYISTAGGAFLEWMEGKELPGVAVMAK